MRDSPIYGPGRFALMLPARILFLAAPALALASCGSGQPEADPAAVDSHLNQIVANEEAAKERLIEEARDREDVREREMEQREVNQAEPPA